MFFKYLFLAFFFISLNAFAECPKDVTAVFKSNLSDPPYLICAIGGTVDGQPIGKCEFMADSMNKKSDGFEIFAHTTGKDCLNITSLNETKNPDQEPKPTELECNVSSCPNPNNLRCPTGYTRGSFNGQSLCVKNSAPEPENPCADAENSDNCSPDATNTEVIAAVNDANISITESVNNLGDAIVNGLDKSNEKLGEIAEKIKNLATGGGGHNGDGEWSGGVDTSGFETDLPVKQLTQQQFKENLFSYSAQCPSDTVLNMSFMGGNVHHEFSYEKICETFQWLGYLVMIMAYLYGAYIVSRA